MAATIDEKLVRHVALLARIQVSDQDVVQFTKILGDILAYVDKLQELDTSGIEPMAHAADVHTVLAQDLPQPSLPPELALANAPDRQDDLYRVPKVIGEM